MPPAPMTEGINLIVFTDLDGTLIDHDTYKWDAARSALNALKQISAGVVLASSKTAAEIAPLRRELDLDHWPAIVENGAGLLPTNTHDIEGGSRYRDLRLVLDEVPAALRGYFNGFGDASVAKVAQMTGLTRDAAALAKTRQFSEPGEWTGTAAQKDEFVQALAALGVIAQQGGRFLTLSFGGNKVDRMREVIDTYHPQTTVALGDAPNDVKMLEHAQFGIVIPNPHRPAIPALKGETEGRIIRANFAGPLGWNEAILNLLTRLNLR